MTDYERGVEQASAVYKEVIREYVAENAKLRKLLKDTLPFISEETGFCTADCYMCSECCYTTSDSECPVVARIHERARELGVEVDG